MAKRNQRNDGYYPSWGRRPGESDEDYEDRKDDWNQSINND